MIHSDGAAPRRRIAVIEIPRRQSARLGMIRPGDPVLAPSWSPTATQEPSSSENFLSVVIQKQNHATLTTPGTLTYTPANRTPAPYIPKWNNWNSPNCQLVDAMNTAAATPPAAPAAPAFPRWWLIVGVLSGAAALKYILEDR